MYAVTCLVEHALPGMTTYAIVDLWPMYDRVWCESMHEHVQYIAPQDRVGL